METASNMDHVILQVQTREGQIFSYRYGFLRQSRTLDVIAIDKEKLREDPDSIGLITIPDVTGEIFEVCMIWCERHEGSFF